MRALLAFAVTLVTGLALMPALIGQLARRHAGQRLSAWTPATHLEKAGTPTMGGLLFVVLAVAAWAVLDHSRLGLSIAFAILAGGAIGALDDVNNIRGRLALGLLGRQKLVLQLLVGVLVGVGLHAAGATSQLVPLFGTHDLDWAIVPIAALAVVAASNAVNLTDGVDGLAGSCSLVAFAALWLLSAHTGARPAAVLSAATCGGVLAFLAYNWWPARVFMGDTGSLALGSGLAAASAAAGVLWLLPLLGLVFVAETLSVIINVTAIRRFKRRIFRASPLHHHFEALGLRERRLVVSFAGVGALAAGLTLLLGWRSAPGAR